MITVITDVQIKINSFLRAIDNYLNRTNDKKFDYSIIDKFQPIDLAAEELLNQIISLKGEIPTMDLRAIYEQFKGLHSQIIPDIDTLITNLKLK